MLGVRCASVFATFTALEFVFVQRPDETVTIECVWSVGDANLVFDCLGLSKWKTALGRNRGNARPAYG